MNIEEYIKSGILELYVLGIASEKEVAEVEKIAAAHKEVRDEIEEISNALEKLAKTHSKKPPLTVKPLLMATIDYTERLKAGEPMSFPPELNENSKIEDYKEWLHRKDMVVTEELEGIYAKIIGYTPQATTAIVWIKEMAPEEVHDNEYEKFLIVEGECDIVVNGKAHHLVRGNYFAIPLHSNHHVKVTSAVPCKVILQRIAA